jgi:hypothetical protein
MEKQILPHGQIVDQAQFLENDAHTLMLGSLFVDRLVWPLLQKHLSRICAAQSGNDIAKGAFTGSILSDQRVDFSTA